MKAIALVVGLLLVALSATAGEEGPVRWSDDYDEAIGELVAGLEEKHKDFVQAVVGAPLTSWQRTADYTEARDWAKSIAASASAMARLEYGSSESPGYRLIWAVLKDGEVLVNSNVGHGLTVTRLKESEWAGIGSLLADDAAWVLPSDGYLTTSDGGSYFVSLWANGRSHQFVIYDLADVEKEGKCSSDRRAYAERTEAHRRLIESIKALGRLN